MKTRNRALSAMLVGLSLLTVSAGASARDRDHDRFEHRAPGWGAGGRWGHDHHRDVRVVERRYVVREQPRYYYERPRPIYRNEPGITVRIGLPPIIIR
jgi:hypothetical protein